MEELLALVLQVLFEVFIQLLGTIGFNFLDRTTQNDEGCGWLIFSFVVGGMVGGLSLLIFPTVLLPTLGLRIANLILAPICAGASAFAVAEVGVLSGSPWSHCWRGFWFALAFGLVRFIWAAR